MKTYERELLILNQIKEQNLNGKSYSSFKSFSGFPVIVSARKVQNYGEIIIQVTFSFILIIL